MLICGAGSGPVSAHAYEAWRGPTGLLKHTEEKSFDGYTVLAPLGSTKTFLIDNDANIINVWESEYRNGSSAIMLPNGHLLRGSTLPREEIAVPFGGFAGLLEEFDWEGNKVWELKVNSRKGVFHHGMQRLPNGNTMVIAWEYKTREEAIAKGRNPETLGKMSITIRTGLLKSRWKASGPTPYLNLILPARLCGSGMCGIMVGTGAGSVGYQLSCAVPCGRPLWRGTRLDAF